MTNSDELKVFDAASIKMPPPRKSDWGGWRREGLELVYPAYGTGVYPVALEGLNSSAVMLGSYHAGCEEELGDKHVPCRTGSGAQRPAAAASLPLQLRRQQDVAPGADQKNDSSEKAI